MKKLILLISVGLVFFCLGVVFARTTLIRYQLYPLPHHMQEEQGDGATVRFVYFSPDNRPLIGKPAGSLVVEFWDWKNNSPVKRVTYPSNTGKDDRIFYSNESTVAALVDDHVLFIYDKATQTVQTVNFDPQYHLLSPTPDNQSLLAYTPGDSQTLFLLDKNGQVRFQQTLAESLEPLSVQFFAEGRKVGIITNLDLATPSKLFIWDIEKNLLIEDTRRAVVQALPFSTLELDTSGKPYLHFRTAREQKNIAIDVQE